MQGKPFISMSLLAYSWGNKYDNNHVKLNHYKQILPFGMYVAQPLRLFADY